MPRAVSPVAALTHVRGIPAQVRVLVRGVTSASMRSQRERIRDWPEHDAAVLNEDFDSRTVLDPDVSSERHRDPDAQSPAPTQDPPGGAAAGVPGSHLTPLETDIHWLHIGISPRQRFAPKLYPSDPCRQRYRIGPYRGWFRAGQDDEWRGRWTLRRTQRPRVVSAHGLQRVPDASGAPRDRQAGVTRRQFLIGGGAVRRRRARRGGLALLDGARLLVPVHRRLRRAGYPAAGVQGHVPEGHAPVSVSRRARGLRHRLASRARRGRGGG